MIKERTTEGIYFTFEHHSLWIRGIESATRTFTISDMYYEVEKDRNRGFARESLSELRKHYQCVYVSEVTSDAESFWKKMKEENIITDVVSYWD